MNDTDFNPDEIDDVFISPGRHLADSNVVIKLTDTVRCSIALAPSLAAHINYLDGFGYHIGIERDCTIEDHEDDLNRELSALVPEAIDKLMNYVDFSGFENDKLTVVSGSFTKHDTVAILIVSAFVKPKRVELIRAMKLVQKQNNAIDALVTAGMLPELDDSISETPTPTTLH